MTARRQNLQEETQQHETGLFGSTDLCFAIPLGCVSSSSPWRSSCNMPPGLPQGLLNMTEPSSSSSSDWLTTVSKPLRDSSESESGTKMAKSTKAVIHIQNKLVQEQPAASKWP